MLIHIILVDCSQNLNSLLTLFPKAIRPPKQNITLMYFFVNFNWIHQLLYIKGLTTQVPTFKLVDLAATQSSDSEFLKSLQSNIIKGKYGSETLLRS